MKLTTEQTLQQGIALHNEGKLEGAERLYVSILKVEPQHSTVHNNMANIKAHHSKFEDAIAGYMKAIELKPNYVEAYHNLGITLYKIGRFNEAELNFRKAIELKPDYAEAYVNIAIIYGVLRDYKEAEKNCRKAILLNPNLVEAYNNLGIILNKLEKLDEAQKIFIKAIELRSNNPEVYCNMGNTLQNLGKVKEAEVSYRKAITLTPNFIEAHYNLANILRDTGKFYDAELSYKKAIELKPNYAEAYNNLGTVYQCLFRLNEAEASYKKATELKPDYAEAYSNLGDAQKFLEKIDDSLINYNRAYVLKPDMDFLLGAFMHIKMHLCIWDDFADYIDLIIKKINKGKRVSPTFQLLSLIDNPNIHKISAEIYTNFKFPKSDILPLPSKYEKHKKIKIGYFSADFMNHPVSRLNVELYENHDRKNFEIYAFSFGPDIKDEFNIKIKKGVDHFHDVSTKSDLDIVKFARSLKIDIAIDLGGFTKGNRQGIFAMSAAPIQVSYLGYPGTMAAVYIDYLIADHSIIINENKNYYSEKVVYMPNSYQANLSKKNIFDTSLSRKEAGLPELGFVFCCFNNQYKITPTTFAGWMRILKATEDSVLWLFVKNNVAINNLQKEAIKHGVNKNRLIFAQHKPNEEHLKRIQKADLFLDTLPYNAHTTASDALKVGLPLLTCIGNSFASRVAASLLHTINLPELITRTQEEYELVAIELAKNPIKMKIIREKLIKNLTTTPLFNIELYTRDIEAAYTIMYKRYQNDLKPSDIEIN